MASLATVNGVDPNVLDGHLWAFLNLNLTGQATEVFNSVPTMHGLEVWRRATGEFLTLTDLRQLDLQALVCAPVAARTLPNVRTSVGDWETPLRTSGGVGGFMPNTQRRNILLKLLPTEVAVPLIMYFQDYPTSGTPKQRASHNVDMLVWVP